MQETKHKSFDAPDDVRSFPDWYGAGSYAKGDS